MIALASDCLLFELGNGETIPLASASMCIEISGESAALFDAEFVRHAADAVFHYFKYELGRQTVSMGEFSEALEKVLTGFIAPMTSGGTQTRLAVLESDLRRLAEESGTGSELFFFSGLRAEFRRQVSRTPRVLRFRGLRCCVKRLIGARRWCGRCRELESQIIDYLRECLNAEPRKLDVALVVD